MRRLRVAVFVAALANAIGSAAFAEPPAAPRTPRAEAPIDPDATALAAALVQTEAGHYDESLALLEAALGRRGPDQAADARLLFWSGFDLFSLQQPARAAERFRAAAAVDREGEFPTIPYLLGQCEYATGAYPPAVADFDRAAAGKIETASSNYYAGYIRFLLRDDAGAIARLRGVRDDAEAPRELRVAAAFQLGEVGFRQGEDEGDAGRKRELFARDAIPAYESALALDPEGETAPQAKARIEEARAQIAELGPQTDGGVPIPVKPWLATINLDVKYDSNIINQADNRIIKVSYAGSPYERVSSYLKYEQILRNWIAVSPELAFDATLNNRREVPAVFQNDSYGLNPALRLRLDRRFLGRAASTLIEYEFGYQHRDYRAEHDLLYYNRSHNFVLGERAQLIDAGTTTLSANLRMYAYAEGLDSQNSVAPGVTLTQNWRLGRGYAISSSFNFETLSANDPINDQRSYRLSLASGIPDLPARLSLDYSLGAQLVDTMEQSVTRGLEKNLSAGVTLTRYLDEAYHYSVYANYGFTRNLSDDTENYQYTKHVIGLGLSLVF